MKRRWRATKATITGRTTITAAAIMVPQSVTYRPVKRKNWTGAVCSAASCRKVTARRNSFQLHKPTTRATVMIPGATTGSRTRVKTCHSLAPSTQAASSSSTGTCRKYARKRKMAKGE